MLPGAPTLHEHEELIRLLMAAEGERQCLQQRRRPRRPRPQLCYVCLLPFEDDLPCGCPLTPSHDPAG